VNLYPARSSSPETRFSSSARLSGARWAKYYDAVVNFFWPRRSLFQDTLEGRVEESEHTAFFPDCYRAGLSAQAARGERASSQESQPLDNQYRGNRVEDSSRKFREIYNITALCKPGPDSPSKQLPYAFATFGPGSGFIYYSRVTDRTPPRRLKEKTIP
jgi:hypothetical protein